MRLRHLQTIGWQAHFLLDKRKRLVHIEPMKRNELTADKVETMFQDGLLSKFERDDLLKKIKAREARASAN